MRQVLANYEDRQNELRMTILDTCEDITSIESAIQLLEDNEKDA